MPIPGSRVIPAGWEAAHMPVAVGTMTSTCEIFAHRPRQGITDAGETAPVATGLPCRVQQYAGGAINGADMGRERVTREYLVTLPATTGVTFTAGSKGHRVRITRSSTPGLAGAVFTIKQVLTGSLIWEQDLICEEDTIQNTGG